MLHVNMLINLALARVSSAAAFLHSTQRVGLSLVKQEVLAEGPVQLPGVWQTEGRLRTASHPEGV